MKILLASGNRFVSERWKGLLADRNSFEIASSLEELKALLNDDMFDLILMHRLLIDLHIFGNIRQLAPNARIFLLSDQPDVEEGISFLKLGIVGYGNTYISSERLLEALNAIESGGVWLGQKIIQQLIHESHVKATSVSGGDIETRLSVLTRMERRVAELVARGLTNLEIAAELNIAERTVKAHLTSIYERMRLPNRLSLALHINQGLNR